MRAPLRKNSLQLAALCVSAILLFASAAAAQQSNGREEGANAASLGVADAVRSSAVGPTALYFNPGAMHQFRQYTIETGYQFVSPYDGHVFTASIVDSATNDMLSAGFSYSYLMGHEMQNEDTDRTGHMVRAALASGYRSEDFTVHAGVGIRYLDLTVGADGVADGFTMDVGVLVVFKGMFRIAVVGHNLIETDLSETPRRLGLGASVLYHSLLVSFDSVVDFESLDSTEAQYNVGVEYAIGGQVPLRIGYQYDRILDRMAITGGIGYVSRVIAVDFGFAQNLDNQQDNIFSLNVRAFIP